MMNSVIVRIEVDSMRQAILHAFTERQIEITKYLEQSLLETCTPERLQRIIDDQTRYTIDAVIKEEVDSFYRYGVGRKMVSEVLQQLFVEGTTKDANHENGLGESNEQQR